MLHRIDGRGYKAYKEIRGSYEFSDFTLSIDYVQGDPFAAPSRMHVRVPQPVAQFPAWTFANDSRRIGLENYLATAFAAACRTASERSGSGKSGLLAVDAPGQEVLERTAIHVTEAWVEARFVAGLPASGRRVRGRSAAAMLCDALPGVIDAALRYANGDAELIRRYVETSEDADALRAQLRERGLVAFVADGSLLPRRSGVDDRPLDDADAVRFASPASLRTTFDLPNAGAVSGMGIPAGVTLIVGGGFHGKSTLLNALERGVYNHRPGDGREFVSTVADAVKIRAEDGRSVAGVDISPFIRSLPTRDQNSARETTAFSTPNASGSTSQAANIMEALELGARALLIDEDTAATNFMIRDRRMQALIARENEPITPFIDRVQPLYRGHGVSTVLVIGGSGDYFDVADTVIAMERYVPRDLTEAAREVAAQIATGRVAEGGSSFRDGATPTTARVPVPRSVDPSRGRREVNVKVRGREVISFGEESIDLSSVAQLVDESQSRAIAQALVYARETYMDGQRSLREIVDCVMADLAREGLDVLDRRRPGDLARFRRFELGAALNRLRTLKMRTE